jgi:hypothetical protein
VTVWLMSTKIFLSLLDLRWCAQLQLNQSRCRGANARARHVFKDPLDLGGTSGEALSPERVSRILDQLDERYEKTPLHTFDTTRLI